LHKIEALVGHELERVTYSAIDNVECNHMDTAKKYNKKIKTKMYDPEEEEAEKKGLKPEFKGEKKNPLPKRTVKTVDRPAKPKFEGKREEKREPNPDSRNSSRRDDKKSGRSDKKSENRKFGRR